MMGIDDLYAGALTTHIFKVIRVCRPLQIVIREKLVRLNSCIAGF